MREITHFQKAMLTALKTGDIKYIQPWFEQYSEEALKTRLGVYQASIIATRKTTLEKIFRPLYALIGPEAADELFRFYARKYISRHFDLNQYGKYLAKFIKTAPWFENYPYTADLCDFCWHWQQVFLKKIPVFLVYTYPVDQIWQHCQPEFKGNISFHYIPKKYYYKLFRDNTRVVIQNLNYHQYITLTGNSNETYYDLG